MIFVLILIFFLTVNPCSAQHYRQSQSPLVLNKSSGTAPLNVTIAGPAEFASRLSNWDGQWKEWGGAGFSVDWGDGITQPTGPMHEPRGSLARHTYTVPGTYSIRASTYHLGPTDSAVTEWSGTATVTVDGEGKQGLSLKITSPQDGASCQFQQYPKLKLKLSIDQGIDLVIQVLDQFGAVVDQDEIKNIRYNQAEQEYTFHPHSSKVLERDLLRGADRFHFRVAVRQHTTQAILRTADSGTFSMSRNFGFTNLKVQAVSATNPLSITVSYPVFYPPAFSYDLEWGDGSSDKNLAGSDDIGVLQVKPTFFAHIYPHSGTYTIKLRSNNLDPRKSLDKIVGVEILTLRVGM